MVRGELDLGYHRHKLVKNPLLLLRDLLSRGVYLALIAKARADRTSNARPVVHLCRCQRFERWRLLDVVLVADDILMLARFDEVCVHKQLIAVELGRVLPREQMLFGEVNQLRVIFFVL